MISAPSSDSKVLFSVPGEDGSSRVGTLWATALGADESMLDNSPFYAYSVSWEDIVYAPVNEAEGLPTVVRVVKMSGHRTIRVIFDPPGQDGNESEVLLQGFLALGCTCEGVNRGDMAIDLPPTGSSESVRQYVIGRGAQWEHADPTYAEMFPDEA